MWNGWYRNRGTNGTRNHRDLPIPGLNRARNILARYLDPSFGHFSHFWDFSLSYIMAVCKSESHAAWQPWCFLQISHISMAKYGWNYGLSDRTRRADSEYIGEGYQKRLKWPKNGTKYLGVINGFLTPESGAWFLFWVLTLALGRHHREHVIANIL